MSEDDESELMRSPTSKYAGWFIIGLAMFGPLILAGGLWVFFEILFDPSECGATPKSEGSAQCFFPVGIITAGLIMTSFATVPIGVILICIGIYKISRERAKVRP